MDDPTFTQIFNIIIAIALGDRAPHQVEATPGVIVGICLVIIFSLSYTYIKMYKKVRVPCRTRGRPMHVRLALSRG